MRRVYLDQNKWLDLARAAHNRPGGQDFKDILAISRYGVERGLVSFPLSASHYMETLRRGDAASRHRLAMVMAELSRFHAIASAPDVLPGELDRALRKRYGKPVFPRPLQVFGVGIAHAFANPDFKYRLPEEVRVDPHTKARLEEQATLLLEHTVLAGPAQGVPVPGMEENNRYSVHGQRYVEAEQKIAEGLRQHDPGRQHLADWIAKTELVDILQPLNEAFARGPIAKQESTELDTAEGMTGLLMDLPSRVVTYELRRLQHQSRDTKWKPNDLADVALLSVAIPYCDVVVTEKQWCHMARRAKLDRRFDTVILHDLKELAAVLVTV
jgi:hypothetical protein